MELDQPKKNRWRIYLPGMIKNAAIDLANKRGVSVPQLIVVLILEAEAKDRQGQK